MKYASKKINVFLSNFFKQKHTPFFGMNTKLKNILFIKMDVLVDKIKTLVRPLKRMFVEDILDRLLSRSIKSKRLSAEAKQRVLPKSKGKVLFNTQYHWHYSWVDYSIAAALKYRGFDTAIFLCDGLPYCEYETVSIKRPSCNRCYRLTKRHTDAFGLNSYRMSDFINSKNRKDCYNFAYRSPINKLRYFKKDGINIGEIAYHNFLHYYKGVYEISKDKETMFRKCVYSGLLISIATEKLIKFYKPSKVVTPNGKFIQSAILIEFAKKFRLPYYTWDVFTQNTSTCFAKNEISHDQRIDDLWDSLKEKKLSEQENIKVEEYFKLQSESKNTPYQYYNKKSVIKDESIIRNKLGLHKSKKIISLFTNVGWDSTALGLNTAYSSMQDWVFSMIEFVQNNPEFELVVRAHPGELKVPYSLRTTTPICDAIIKELEHLPSNLHLIGPAENISSYSLAQLSDVVMVYSSTLGIEFSVSGIRPWVAANPYYSNKGFTVDIHSHNHAKSILKENIPSKYLTDQEIELAKKFAYVVKFRRLFSFPLLSSDGKFLLKKYEDLLTDGNFVIENICQFIDDKRSYIDIGLIND